MRSISGLVELMLQCPMVGNSGTATDFYRVSPVPNHRPLCMRPQKSIQLCPNTARSKLDETREQLCSCSSGLQIATSAIMSKGVAQGLWKRQQDFPPGIKHYVAQRILHATQIRL